MYWHLRSVYKQIQRSGVRIGFILWLFVSVFMLGWSSGTSSSSPDFCQLRFRGVSSCGKLIPELASSHMVSITFFPADLAGYEARPSLQDSATWTGLSAPGSKEMRRGGRDEGEERWRERER